MNKINIAAVVGSLRKDSFNRQLALAVQKALEGRANFTIIEYDDVPLMNQDLEFPAPEAVARVRAQVKAADALWIFTPEYNHFFPGVLKNLLDWLSRPISEQEGQVLTGKPVVISGATPSTSGTALAQDHLVTLLSYLNMDIMNAPRLTIASVFNQLDAQGKLELQDSAPFFQAQVDAFIDFVKARAAFKA